MLPLFKKIEIKKEYIIEDQIHCEWIWKYNSISDATSELQRLLKLPWNKDKNLAPCMSYKTCGREYELIEYNIKWDIWDEVSRYPIFDIKSSGIIFHQNPYITF